MITPRLPDSQALSDDLETMTEVADDDELVANTYAQLRAIAAGHFSGQPVSHTLQPTALVHEAVLKIIRSPRRDETGRWNSQEHFLSTAAAAMRQILIDHARGKAARKRNPATPETFQEPADACLFAVTFLELNEAIDALTRLDPRAAQGVMLRFFAGLTIPQTAQVQGVSEFTVERDWRAARAFLARQLAAPTPQGALR